MEVVVDIKKTCLYWMSVGTIGSDVLLFFIGIIVGSLENVVGIMRQDEVRQNTFIAFPKSKKEAQKSI